MQALYLGLKFDLRLVLLITLPVFLLGWIKYIDPFAKRYARIFWNSYFALLAAIILIFYITDFGYFAYLHIRLDATILRFLNTPLISLTMVWQTYSVVWWALLFITTMVLYSWAMNYLILRFAQSPVHPLNKRKKVLAVTLTFFLVLFGLYGKFSWYPLRWSDAFFTTHSFASATVHNPVLYFFDTIRHGGEPYNEDKVRQSYDEVAAYLGVSAPDKQMLNYTRHVPAQKAPTNNPQGTQPNIIMVYLESFASYKTGLSGNPLDPTPNFDAIANSGTYFKNFFTPHTGTARSVFAGTTGLPDVQLNDTSSRNPTIVNQHMIISEYESYDHLYFLGGSANWGNIRGLLQNNIPDLQVFEEGSYESPRVDGWGISDLDLFKEANQVLRQQDKPFFAIIQTSGNHRPYTIPEDNHDFIAKKHDKKELKKYGFISLKEFNSFHFLDHSIGYFMEHARKEAYFDNTIFVFFGDHGLSGDAGNHAPPSETQLGLGSLRVPLVIYSPKHFPQAKVLDTVAGEVDIQATLAGLTGITYTNTTLGRDLLNPVFDEQRYAFTIEHSRMPIIGLVGDEFYFRSGADGKNKALHQLTSKSPRENVASKFPQKAKEMERLTFGLFETSKYIANNNPRKTIVD